MKSRGIRNNNPGNIERNYIKWDGMAEDQSGDDRFIIFESPEWGIRAMVKILINYEKIHGLDCIGGIIERWAPSSENDTESYIHSVCMALNSGPYEPLNMSDPETLATLAKAIIRHENGSQPYDNDVVAEGVRRALL